MLNRLRNPKTYSTNVLVTKSCWRDYSLSDLVWTLQLICSRDEFLKMRLLREFWGGSWEPKFLTQFQHAEFHYLRSQAEFLSFWASNIHKQNNGQIFTFGTVFEEALVKFKIQQEAKLPLREQGVSFLLLSHHNTTHKNFVKGQAVLKSLTQLLP